MFRSILALLATGFVAVSGAQAQLTKIFVASYGNDVNDGSRGSPKRNFQAALNAVAAGGEIVALDTAGYGLLSITKSVTITSPPGITGLISASSNFATGVYVNAPNADVTLRGLTIENVGTAGYGIIVNAVARLNVGDCVINGFSQAGLTFSPPNGNGGAIAIVTRCTIRDCGGPAIQMDGNQTTRRMVVTGCNLESCSHGLVVVGSGALDPNTVNCTLRDTVAAGNGTGVEARQAASLTLQQCTISANANYGVYANTAAEVTVQNSAVTITGITAIRANDSNSVVRIDGCTISENRGAAFDKGSGNILSRGNNTVANNSGTSTTLGSYSAQ
jgi:hypothetical protein